MRRSSITAWRGPEKALIAVESRDEATANEFCCGTKALAPGRTARDANKTNAVAILVGAVFMSSIDDFAFKELHLLHRSVLHVFWDKLRRRTDS